MISINQNNKGMTLVEILVVVAILGILTGTAGVSISLAFSRDAERCAKTIDTALESTRMSAMSRKGDFTLEINRGSNQLATESSEAVGVRSVESLQNQVNITFQSATDDLSATNVLRITFDQSTGKVLSIQADGTAIPSNLVEIRCTNQSGSKAATVVLVRRTGKHYVEYGS